MKNLTRWLVALALTTTASGLLCSAQTVNYKTDGQDFSPYIDGQDPNLGSQISEQQLRDRMALVAPYTRWIRTFGTTDGLEKAGLVARSLGLKAAIGAWISRDANANERQIKNLISICQAGQCDMAIVGSEALLRGDVSEAQLLDYIGKVKQAIPAGIPVTTADVYGQWLNRPDLISNVDIIMGNFYPFWEGIRIDLAMSVLHANYNNLKAAAGGKQVLVSETGWPSGGNSQGAAVPSSENASFFFLNFVSWARANNVQYFYFESFDETWKAAHEGPVGSHWGIFDTNGILKPGMQDVFDGKTIPDNWGGGVVNCDPSLPNLSFTHVPAYNSFDNLSGRVCRVRPADFRIVTYIRVINNWWVKPFATQPLTTILNDGTWSCDITTGGVDQRATEIVSYLIPTSFSPPILLGSSTLPATLDENSVAKVHVSRCTYSLTLESQRFSSNGGSGELAVTAIDSLCEWTSQSNDNWIVINAGSTGTGNQTVRYSVAANQGARPRTGTLTVAGKTFFVTQDGTALAWGQPILVSEETSTRAIALDAVVWSREPFRLSSPVPWGSDNRTRVSIFAMNLELLPGENSSLVTADAEDVSHHVYPLTVEYVGKVQGFDWLSCIVIRLADDMGDTGDVLVRVKARGVSSNRVRLGVGHIGGGLNDDPGAIPTPGRP